MSEESSQIWTTEQIHQYQLKLDEMRLESERHRRKCEHRILMMNLAMQMVVYQMNAPLRALADDIRAMRFDQ